MPVSERQRVIREAVGHLRAHIGDEPIAEDNAFRACEDLAEILALLVAFCRAQQVDEALAVEIVVRAIDTDREQLGQTAAILSKLGYHRVAPTLRRLGRRARPRPPSFKERMRLKQMQMRLVFEKRITAIAR
jgi:hypothetical protein